MQQGKFEKAIQEEMKNGLYYMTIYKLTFPNSKVYVGQSCDITNRFAKHRACLVPATKEAVKEFKWDNVVREIVCVVCKQDANKYEKHLIQIHKATDPQFGYNKFVQGRNHGSNYKHSEETKRKIRERNKAIANTAEHRKYISERTRQGIAAKKAAKLLAL